MEVNGGSNWQSPGSPSSGADNFGQGRQLCVLQPLTLMQFLGSGAVTGNVTFRIEVPDSRLRVKLVLLGVAADRSAQAFIGAKGLTMWLREVEDSQQGLSGIPITNLWGTHGEAGTGPAPIPGYVDPITGLYVADAGLGGWGKEFVTIGKAIMGDIHYAAPILSGAGQLILEVRYSPEGTARFARDEWQELCAQTGRSIIGGAAASGLA